MLNNKNIQIISLVVLMCVVPISSGKTAESVLDDNRILARVDDEILTLKEFNSELDTLPEEVRSKVTDRVKEEVVKKWIRTQLFSREAKRRGIDKSEDVQKRVEEFKKDLLTKELIKDELENKKITDDDLKKYYDEHKSDYTIPTKVIDFTEVKEKIRGKLLAERVKETVEKLENELEIKNKVIKNLELLKTVQ